MHIFNDIEKRLKPRKSIVINRRGSDKSMDNQIVEGPVKLLPRVSINQSTHTKRASNEISISNQGNKNENLNLKLDTNVRNRVSYLRRR